MTYKRHYAQTNQIAMQESIIISLGGSLFAPKEDTIDTEFLHHFITFITSYVNQGKRFFIIAGGGRPARLYQNALKDLIDTTNNDLDLIGIHTTRLNAQLIRMGFQEKAYPNIITDPTTIESDVSHFPIAIAAGWHPGNSTDLVAVKLAETVGAQKVINLSNIDYVYTADPRENPYAQKITQMSWVDFQELVGDTWDPGASAPFDPIASKLAASLNLEVAILNGKNFENLDNYLKYQDFEGSIIK